MARKRSAENTSKSKPKRSDRTARDEALRDRADPVRGDRAMPAPPEEYTHGAGANAFVGGDRGDDNQGFRGPTPDAPEGTRQHPGQLEETYGQGGAGTGSTPHASAGTRYTNMGHDQAFGDAYGQGTGMGYGRGNASSSAGLPGASSEERGHTGLRGMTYGVAAGPDAVAGRPPADYRGRGPRGWTRTDDRIRDDVCQRLADDPHVDASDMDIAVSNGEVTLEGIAYSRPEKRHAEDLAMDVSGVKDVHNRLIIRSRGNLDQSAHHPRDAGNP